MNYTQWRIQGANPAIAPHQFDYRLFPSNQEINARHWETLNYPPPNRMPALTCPPSRTSRSASDYAIHLHIAHCVDNYWCTHTCDAFGRCRESIHLSNTYLTRKSDKHGLPPPSVQGKRLMDVHVRSDSKMDGQMIRQKEDGWIDDQMEGCMDRWSEG